MLNAQAPKKKGTVKSAKVVKESAPVADPMEESNVRQKNIEASEMFDLGKEQQAMEHVKKYFESPYMDADLCYKIGLMLCDPKKLNQPCEGIKWLLKASDGGVADAQFATAYMCYHKQCLEGAGLSYDDHQVWYRIAAEKGQPKAMNNYGLINKEEKKIVQWFKKSANAGSPAGQYNYGLCNEVGKHLAKNLDEAINYYRKSAEAGFPRAQYHLATMYEKGNGLRKNSEEALKFMTLAAESGVREAQMELSVAYEKGKMGAKRDPEAARKWGDMASENHVDEQAYGEDFYESQIFEDTLKPVKAVEPIPVEIVKKKEEPAPIKKEKKEKKGKKEEAVKEEEEEK